MSFYSLSAKSLQGDEISMEEFKGKIVLVVNTASKCGFTPQYEGLEELYKKYKDRGLVILGFPCNQFGKQEPGDEASIQSGCMINYGVTFPMFSKIDVNGSNTHPIYSFLKKEKGGILGDAIKWNFTKFLVDQSGKVIKRYASIVEPSQLEVDIEKLLAK